jgi:hypothetical protein
MYKSAPIIIDANKLATQYKVLDVSSYNSGADVLVDLPGWMYSHNGAGYVSGSPTKITSGGYVLDNIYLSTTNKSFFGGALANTRWYSTTDLVPSYDPAQASIENTKQWINIDLDSQTAYLDYFNYVGFKQSNFSRSMLISPNITTSDSISAKIVIPTDHETLTVTSGTYRYINNGGDYIDLTSSVKIVTGDRDTGFELIASKKRHSGVAETILTEDYALVAGYWDESASESVVQVRAERFLLSGESTNYITATSSGTTIHGDLTVNGTTTTVNSTTVTVDDKNIELASTASPSDVLADGAGITVKGTGNKTWTWVDATNSWTSNQDIDIVSTGTDFRIAGTSVLNGTTLGALIANSSLTKVAPLSGGTAGFVKVDASGNLTSTSASASMTDLMGYTSTAMAGGTTVFTSSSTYYQLFTGSSTTTQTVTLPVTSTLALGWTFHIVNNSTGTGNITVNSSGGNLVIVIPPGSTAMATCIATAGTGAANWEAGLTDFSTYTGTGGVVLSTSPTLSGTVVIDKTTYGFSVISAAPANVTYWKIATLPITSAGTYDHVVIDAVLDDSWGSDQKVTTKILFSNRNAFTYRYYLNGTVRSNSRILAYTEADGSVSIYLRAGTANYCSFSYNITHGIDNGTIIYKNPTSTTTAPTGTLAFDSSVIATYVPEMYVPYTGQPIIRGLVSSSGVVSGSQFVRSGGTSGQFLKADGSVDSNSYLATTSSYFAGHNPEGRLMYNTYLTNDMANARLRGSAVAATQNGSPYTISNANWDAMFDGTATFFNISPTSGFTFPLVITVPLPRTLTYGTWVGLSFGSTTFRANSITIEVFSLDSNSWVTIFTTTSNTSEDIFAAASGLTNSNATGINQIRYTIAAPNSTQLRLQHLWAYNFNSDMWSQTMMPRAGGSFYGPISPPSITTTGGINATGNWSNSFGGSQISNSIVAVRPASSNIGLIVRGAASQTADLQQLQDSAANVLGGFSATGRLLTGGSSATAVGSLLLGAPTSTVPQQLGVVAREATTIGAVIRGAASQTADLTQWQDSAGATLASVLSNGVIKGAEVRTNNTQAVLREVASGGNLYMVRATSTPGNPGASVGTLFYRDGTTAGTLRLATRTGASGVEETIVDNLSSTGSTAGAQFVGAGGVNTAGNILTTGRVGGGTASPAVAGHFAGAGNIGRVRIQNTDADPVLEMTGTSGTSYLFTRSSMWHIRTDNNSNHVHLQQSDGGTNYQGRVGIGMVSATNATPSGQLHVTAAASNSTTLPTFVVQAVLSQTANLQEWRDSAGTPIASIQSGGNIVTTANLKTPAILDTGTATAINFGSSRNVGLFAAGGSFGGGAGVLNIANATTAPTTNPTGGGILYVDAGALSYRGTSNAARTIVNADGTLPVPTAVVNTVSGTNSAELVRGNMADNDQFRILVGGTATNAGFVEIATADDGTEPIHVRQYTGVFTTLARTATLLDGSGNTSFPGSVTSASLSTAGGLSLTSTASTLSVNGSVGTSGFVLTSAGAGATPTWKDPNLVNVNATAKTAAYTLATTDYGTMVQMNGAFAFTVGTGLYNAPVGTQITLLALTAGVTVAASGANVIVNATPGLKLRAQYSTATLICLSSSASACTWLLTGDLSA